MKRYQYMLIHKGLNVSFKSIEYNDDFIWLFDDEHIPLCFYEKKSNQLKVSGACEFSKQNIKIIYFKLIEKNN